MVDVSHVTKKEYFWITTFMHNVNDNHANMMAFGAQSVAIASDQDNNGKENENENSKQKDTMIIVNNDHNSQNQFED